MYNPHFDLPGIFYANCLAAYRYQSYTCTYSMVEFGILHCESKNCATIIFTVTLANVGRFLKFFQCRNQKEMAHDKNEKFPTVA